MSKYILYGCFSWVDYILNGLFDLGESSPVGHVYEVDISYPCHLHDNHKELPFLPGTYPEQGKRGPRRAVEARDYRNTWVALLKAVVERSVGRRATATNHCGHLDSLAAAYNQQVIILGPLDEKSSHTRTANISASSFQDATKDAIKDLVYCIICIVKVCYTGYRSPWCCIEPNICWQSGFYYTL